MKKLLMFIIVIALTSLHAMDSNSNQVDALASEQRMLDEIACQPTMRDIIFENYRSTHTYEIKRLSNESLIEEYRQINQWIKGWVDQLADNLRNDQDNQWIVGDKIFLGNDIIRKQEILKEIAIRRLTLEQ